MKQKQHEILKQALKLIPFDGLNQAMLEDACVKAGFDAKYSQIAFTDGIDSLIELFVEDIDQKMDKKLGKIKLEKLRIRDRIKTLVKTRLELYEPHKLVIGKIIAYHTLPFKSLKGGCILWKTSDNMWLKAGDSSTDFNYYTKRGLLSAVYSTTILYWLNDTSENHQQSWEFLDRRIENIMNFGKAKAKFENFLNAPKQSFQNWRKQD